MPPKISLRAARVNANLSQDEAAKKLGINKWKLLKWEKDPSLVKVKYLPRIEEVYKYPTDYIFFNS